MLLTVTAKGIHTATAQTADNRTIYFTKTNSSWYDWNISGRVVGDTFEVPDATIRVSDSGNPYIERLGADKALAAVRLETAYLKRDNEIIRAKNLEAMGGA